MEDEELYKEAKEAVIMHHKSSAGFLQRLLRIGYFKAARFIDMMEEEGILGPADGAKPRKILTPKGKG